MDAPSAVLALVLIEAAAGGLALLWLAPTWGAVRHGYEILLGGTLALMAIGAWAALRAPLAVVTAALPEVTGAAGAAATAALVTGVTVVLAVVALVVRLPPVLARALGLAATAAGGVTLVALAALRAGLGGAGGLPQGIAELALGALLLGAIWDGMVLGHWYLVERRLSNRYMVWIAWVNVAAVVAGVIALVLSARNAVPCAGLAGAALESCALTFSPILTIGNMTLVLGGGVLALIAVITAFNLRLAHEGGRSIQASTGMFYLAVILAPAAEFAAKVRFF